MKNKSFFAILLCCLGMQAIRADQNPAFYAISQKDTSFLKKSLEQNSQSVQTNDDGQTILHAAVLFNNLEAVKVILKSGLININELDKNGKSAMDYAVEYGHNKMIRTLYKQKGKVTSQDNAQYAKKIITRPFKILFFLSIPVLLIALCLNFRAAYILGGYAGIALLFFDIFFIYSLGAFQLIPGSIGWAYRSHKNLLLTECIV